MRDRRTVVAAATGTAVLGVAAQLALYAGSARTTGGRPVVDLILNLVVDLSLLLVVRFPRTTGLLTMLVTAVYAVGTGLAPGLFASAGQLSPVATPLAAPLVVSFLVYLLPWRQAFACAAVLALLVIPIWAPTWTATYFALSATALPALVALYLKARVALIRSLRKRAELADTERRLLAERAETAERQRLAAEMHDIVTHRVTEIVLHADALRVTTHDDEVRTAAERIRQAGTRTLTELRDLMRVVTNEVETTPGGRPDHDNGGDLAVLAAVDGATLKVVGDPGTVPAVVARTVYRVVQESLTNARKHAPGTPVDITLTYPGNRAEVEVRNAPSRHESDPALVSSGSGIGLIGLGRRVTLLGGVFAAGTDGEGGFTVTASIPAVQPAATPRRSMSSHRRGDGASG
ncbi:sensor histidine kinase [Rhizohabitans arisaemae]|uniref:sensor histidine kinase n=1 Tax=Rhizohabitans arisaemae TaxID=2720610 RepID=UPI0024B091E4|nr:histidine kinase [Rhizohabitans arisaemae]